MGLITVPEYLDQEVSAAVADVVAGGGVSDWFGPALAAELAPMQAHLVNNDARLENIEAQLGKIEVCLLNIEARQTNAVVGDPEAICLLPCVTLKEMCVVPFLPHFWT